MKNKIDELSESDWATIWAAWATAFAVAEYYALKSGNAKAPLSHHIRRTLGVKKAPVYRYAGQVAFGATAVWFVAHIWKEVTES